MLMLVGCLTQHEEKQTNTLTTPKLSSGDSGLTEEQDNVILPGPPSNLRLVTLAADSDLQCQLVWNGTRDDTINGYNIYQLSSPGNWSLIGFITLRKEDSRNRGEYRFSKDIAASGTYAVAAVDNRGTSGPKSPAVQIKTQQPAPKD